MPGGSDEGARLLQVVHAEGHLRVDDPSTPNTGLGPIADADRGALEFQPSYAGQPQNGPPIAQQPIPIAGISCSPSLRVRGVLIGILSPDDRRSSSLVVGTPEKPPRAGSGEPGTGAIAIQER